MTANRRAAADRRYDQSEKGKARYARYQASLKGMMRWNRYDRKRALARGAAQLAERGLLASEEELLANGYHSESSFWVKAVRATGRPL